MISLHVLIIIYEKKRKRSVDINSLLVLKEWFEYSKVILLFVIVIHPKLYSF